MEVSGRPFLTELGLLLMVTIWGVNFAVVKWALDAFEPLGFNALRHVLASVFMLVVLKSRGRLSWPDRSDVPRIIALGFIGNVVYQMAFIFGLDRTRAGNASLMLALVPVFILLYTGGSAARTHARIGSENEGGSATRPYAWMKSGGSRKIAWIGAILSIGGVALVSGSSLSLEGTETLLGDLILIGAAGVWALYTAGAEPLIDRFGPIRTTGWTLLVGSIGLLLAGIPSLVRQDWSIVTPAAWGGVVFSSFFAIGLAYLLWYRGVQQLGGARTAVFSNLTPIIALITGALWLDERITIYTVVGAGLVIGGVLLVRSTDGPPVPRAR